MPASVSETTSHWKQKAVHTITLPSGMRVKIRIPNLTALIQNDVIPERLRAVAVQEALNPGAPLVAPAPQAEQPAEQMGGDTVKQLYELYEFLVCEMVVEPTITKDDLDELPQLDLDMLTQFALRERDMDAAGIRLGIEPISRWEVFRQAHNCPDDCASCERALDGLGTTVR